MVTLHEVITFLVSMQISISSLQTHNVNRCGRSRHLARKLSLRRKRSSPNVFEMAATETITSIIDRKSGSAGMPRPISYAVFCLKKKNKMHSYGINMNIINHQNPGKRFELDRAFTLIELLIVMSI